MLGNLWDDSGTDDYDRIVSAQGFISCSLEPRNRAGSTLERVKYEGDEETHLRIFNVFCAIYPESPEQIEALAAALKQLRARKV